MEEFYSWACPSCGHKLTEFTKNEGILYECLYSHCDLCKKKTWFTESQLKNHYDFKFQEKIHEYNSSTKKAMIITAIATVVTAIAAILALK